MSSNFNLAEGDEGFEGHWNLKQSMEAYDRLRPEFRAAIAYADARYSIEELYTAPEIRPMSRDELLAFLWSHSDGFEIRYPQYVRVQYERARAAFYRNNYVSGWDPWRYGMEVRHGRDSGGPLR